MAIDIEKARLMNFEKVNKLAAQIHYVNFGDHGTFGGNTTELVYDVQELNMDDKLLFAELFCARLKMAILHPTFDDPKSYLQYLKEEK